MKTDDELLQQFFTEVKFDIADNGFSDRVMERIPLPIRRANQIWTSVCFAAAMVFFLLFDGLEQVREIVYNVSGNLVGYLSSVHLSINTLLTLVLAVVLLSVVGLYNFITTQR